MTKGVVFIDVRFGPLSLYSAGVFTAPDYHRAANADDGSSLAGFGIAELVQDFDRESRDAQTPDIGADEIVTVAPPPVAGALGFASASYTAAETSLLVTLVVNRTGGSAGTVAVDYATVVGSATAGADYTATSGTITFGNGVLSQTIVIALIDDNDVENNETFSVTLSNPTNGASITAGQASSQVTITSEDVTTPPPTGNAGMYFSTSGSAVIPTVVSPYNDADIYSFQSGVFWARSGRFAK